MAARPDCGAISEIFRRFREAWPQPKGELEHVDVRRLLSAVAPASQATDKRVIRATRAPFAAPDTPERMPAPGGARPP